MKGKLAPRYIGSFKILERRGEVAYQLELPKSLLGVHVVFHVSIKEVFACIEGADTVRGAYS